MLKYHMIAFVTGFVLDLLFGDPYWLPHPVRWIGSWIGFLDRALLGDASERGAGAGGESGEEDGGSARRDARREMRRGVLLVLLVTVPATLLACCILYLGYRLKPAAGIVLESIMTYQLLALKCLKVESVRVYDRLREKDISGARKAVSMIVGRDTAQLDETGIIKAAVETVAENASDGVIAPMLYLAVLGPAGGFFYKAVNTLDSMAGYKNDRYLFFGRAAARLDDLVNYIPARISALLMILAAYLPGKEFDGNGAWRIFKRDRYKHASPNSAQTESACAGALHIRLAGNASYFGKIVEKPYIGDDLRPVETEDILRANRLLYRTAFLAEGICLAVMALALFFLQ